MTTPWTRACTGCSLRQLGWTLTEMLATLALVSLLAALAVPGYQKQQRQARRMDGQAALLQLQTDQARWRSTHERYADDLSALGWANDRSAQGHYQISITEAQVEGYTLQATPLATQAGDTACNPLRLIWRDGATAVLSAGRDQASDASHCWRR